MSSPSGRAVTARNRGRRLGSALIFAAAAVVSGCKPPPPSAANDASASAVPAVPALVAQLAGARIDAAKSRLESRRPDEALALLTEALRADPASAEARELAGKILAETQWNFPTLTISHGLTVQQIGFAAPSSLWVSLGGEMNVTVRWDLEKLEIGSVLFPAWDLDTRSLVFSPDHAAVVVGRGLVNLLCDARTLKPIRDLGPLPEDSTPAAVQAFSPEGLLVASPAAVDGGTIWQIRDAASGQLLRASEPPPAGAPRSLAAHLDRRRLRVLRADGSLMEMPVSPVDEIRISPMPDPVELLGAQFSDDGESALVSQKTGARDEPSISVISYAQADDGSLEIQRLQERFPWSGGPNLWNGLMAGSEEMPFKIDGGVWEMAVGSHAPVVNGSAITSCAFAGGEIIIGEADGSLTIFGKTPLPGRTEIDIAPAEIDGPGLIALAKLTEALAGVRYDGETREFARIGPEQRKAAFAGCDPAALGAAFPQLDFAPIAAGFAGLNHRIAPAAALQPLWERLARADATHKTWPEILRLSKDLVDTDWHRELTEQVVGKAGGAEDDMDSVFQSVDDAAVLAAISAAGKSGPDAAAALAAALASERPDWIEACLTDAGNLPPLLRQIALSRIAWLQGRKAAALSPWPEDFPQMKEIRQHEDWDGWEQADFAPALEAIGKNVRDELLALDVPADSTPERRKEIAARLADPETVAAIGKSRFALACMRAATAFSEFPEESETTAGLAKTARDLGAPAEPCLRAEALALAGLGDYANARDRWVELITEHPVETHIPGDYAEAAYTAFENSDPQQAMTILTTGIHRYPNDAHFALRAGWVALLTGNSQRAYDFLQAGKRVGYAADRMENATALLTIAAAQSGAWDDANVYFSDLVRLDPAWASAATLDTLDWPEELKTTLLEFMQ